MQTGFSRKAAIVGTLLLASRTSVALADLFWVGTSGSWNDPTNWSNAPNGPGGAGAPTEADWAFVLPNDAINRTILLTPTIDTFKSYRIEVSATGGGTVLFNLTQGTFATNDNWQLWGYVGQAAIVQTGGTNIFPNLELGASTDAFGTYDLHTGHLQGGELSLGPHGGQGIFRQMGGSVDVQGLFVGTISRYAMSAGTATVHYNPTHSAAMVIQPGGEFIQTGGTVITDRLAVYGHYQWSNGSLQVSNHLRIAGQFDFPTTPVSMQIDGFVDLTNPLMVLNNAQNVSLSLTDTSLLIRPASLNPSTIFGSYVNPGFTHIPGNTLTVFPGRNLNLYEDFDDRIEVHGTVNALVDPIGLNGGILLGAGGLIDTGGGVIRINKGTSLVQGGELRARSVEVDGSSGISFPPPPAAMLEHSGGRIITNGVTVGASGPGTYKLSGGSLESSVTDVGRKNQFFSFGTPNGNMTQTGGTHTIEGALRLGIGSGAYGNYTLDGGRLQAHSIQLSVLQSSFFGSLGYGTGWLDVTDASSEILVTSHIAFGPHSTYTAVPGTTIHMVGAGGISNLNTDPAALSGFETTTFIFESGSTDLAPIEVNGADLGLVPEGFVSNFVIDTLQIGGSSFAAVQLVDLDATDSPELDPSHALYVNHLILNPGSYLDLHGLNLYTRQFTNNGGTLLYIGGGQLHVVPEPAAVVPAMLSIAMICWRTRRRDKAMP